MRTETQPATPPTYWKYELRSALGPAIMRYLNAEPLSLRDISEIARYLCNWIESPGWDRFGGRRGCPRRQHSHILDELRLAARRIYTEKDIEEWHKTAAALGVNPF